MRYLQRLRGPETWQLVVGDDQIPAGAGQRLFHRFGGLHPLKLRLVAAAPELVQEEQGVVFGVPHDQHAQRNARLLTFCQLYQDSSFSSSMLTRPVRTAWRAAWVRLRTPSLRRILETWVFTVFSSTKR